MLATSQVWEGDPQKGERVPRQASLWIIIKRPFLTADSVVPYELSSERQGLPQGQCNIIFLLRFIYIWRLGFGWREGRESLAAAVWRRGFTGNQRHGFLCAQARNGKMPLPTILKPCPAGRNLGKGQHMLWEAKSPQTPLG